MNGHNETMPNGVPLNEELSAYLDGEMDAESRRLMEQRLSESGELRQRLKEYQEAWDLLDELPRADVDDSFTRTTVEMVAVRAEDLAVTVESSGRQRRQLAWILGGVAALLMAILGYVGTLHYLSRPNQQLVDDLPILENFDAYQNAGTIEFLQRLHEQELFQEDATDEL